MGKGRILHFGFAGAAELFEAEAVPFRGKKLGVDNHLRNIAIKHGLASLSSPMVGEFWKALIMLNRQFLQVGKWNGYAQLRHSSYDTYLNPQLLDQSAEVVEDWEECCGYPGIRLMVPRAKKVIVKFKEQSKFEDRVSQLTDFSARLLLHEMDHIDCVDPLKLATKLEIVSPELKHKYDSVIQPLFAEMAGRRQPGRSIYEKSKEFNELRRQIAFCITDYYRK